MLKPSSGKLLKGAIRPFMNRIKQINPATIGEEQDYPQGFKRRQTNTNNQLARGRTR